jgi:short-subunit dehydrogenase
MAEREPRKSALVTGASSGLGAAFARRLGADGYDLMLVARRAGRLADLADELGDCHAVVVRCVAADLADRAGIEQVEECVRSLGGLDLLINNAGFGARGPFAETDLRRQLEMIQLHVLASVRLARAALPGMIERNRGGIINVASLAALIPVPGDATYSATKAFLVTFSQALHEELRGTGVSVQALCPGFMRTELHSAEGLPEADLARIPALLWSRPDDVAAESLRALARGQVVCVPGWQNRCIVALARLGVVRLVLRAALKAQA